MADIYVYDAFEENLDTAGMVGALMPTSCEYYPEAGTIGEIQMEHPYDEYGKWRALVIGNILKAGVCMPTLPIISGNKIVTSVEVYKVKSASVATAAQRYIYKDATSDKKSKLLPGGTAVTIMSRPAEGRWKVKTARYGSGWMDPEGIEEDIVESIPETVNGIEAVLPSVFIRPQLFEIISVQQKDEGIVVKGMQISCQLLKNITNYVATGSVNHQTALNGILKNCKVKHEFTAYTDMGDVRTGLSWRLLNPIKAMLDPEEGAAARYGSQFIADDYDLYFLKRAGANRGMRVEYGKNLLGIDCTVDMKNLATRIIPVGKNKDGSDLYLDGTQWIDSPYVNSYPYPHVYVLECKDCTVGTDGVTVAIARARMREQARELLDSGCDIPEITLKVEYSSLGDTEEYKQYRQLERMYLYDLVKIYHKKIGISVDLEAVKMTWDCIRDKPIDVEFGTLRTTSAKLASWQIPSNISGTKLIPNSVGSGQLGNEIINARHMQAESVNTEALQAGSVTAKKIAAGVIAAEAITAVKAALNEITADTIETDGLYAAIAHIFELAADSIEAGDIETDELAAVMAQIGTANIKRANISYAQIVDIFSERIFTDSATAGKFRADNLEVTQAQIVDLIVGSFRLVSGDGKVYNVTIDAEGNLKTEYLYDESEWMENGEIPDGYSAVAGNLTVGDVTAGNLYVSGAAEIMKLTAKWLVADQAWINELTAGLIQSDLGERLNLYSNEAIVGIVETNNETQNDMTILSTRFEQTTERFELEINSKVGAEDLRHYLRYQAGTAELGGSNNRYKLQAAANGVFILQDNDVMTRMEQNTVAAPVFDVGRMLRFAPHEIKVSASGVLLFN